MAQYYYYDTNGAKFGPVTGKDITSLAALGLITPETVVEQPDGTAFTAQKVKGLTFATPVTQVSSPQTPPPDGYFYTDDFGQKCGPVNQQQLREMASQGLITPETLLQTVSGHTGLAGQIKGLFPDGFTPFVPQVFTPQVSVLQRTPPASNPYKPRVSFNTNDGIGYFDVLKKYVTFSGRARRREYWSFVLINILIQIAIIGIGVGLGVGGGGTKENALAIVGIFNLLANIFSLATFLPTLAVLARRLHDIGHSGWMFFIGFIPLVGPLIMLLFLVRDSQPGANQYGPNPKWGRNTLQGQFGNMYAPQRSSALVITIICVCIGVLLILPMLIALLLPAVQAAREADAMCQSRKTDCSGTPQLP